MTKKKYWIWAVLLLFLSTACVLLYGSLKKIQMHLYPQKYSAWVEANAQEFGLDPLLVYAFIRTESGFEPKAESGVGARGLMQITQETYEWIHSKLEPETAVDFEQMYDPATNIRYGCYYVAACLERYHEDISTAAAAYHSGWGTVDSLLQTEKYRGVNAVLTVFPYKNMNRYVEKIQQNYKRYQTLYSK